MAGNTKERILEAALDLFARNGYIGTSMSDIAGRLEITKGALYKHYVSKQEILDSIIERMEKNDFDRAKEYAMPVTVPGSSSKEYMNTTTESIRTYTLAQFAYWTEEKFASNFRKMLTIEQYRDPKLTQLYHDYLVSGPVEYMAEIFRKYTDTNEEATETALEFYGPMFLLYGIYDKAEKKEEITVLLKKHVELFLLKNGFGCDE